ncbi:UNVERIFIED_ORG: pseudaminic acid cytidylyltransferase [Lelliottia amnigena]|jgi:pseudaminic acid cytidylyltransferase|nr:pseudaminic acid cytidylyltransferase [Lelliottia amnigena]
MINKIALIPARGGSKRLPDKNIKQLHGKPLIAWTIEAAILSQLFDKVIVSTDSEKISEVAKHYGAEVPFIRPAEISGDTASTADVVKHAIDFINKNYAASVETICLLQPTSPLRNSSHIEEAYKLYARKNANSVISVCELEHPIQLCNTLDNNLSMNDFISSENIRRSQDYDKYYRLNGAIYIFNSCHVNNIAGIYDSKSYAYVMDRFSSIDIDVKEDFMLAEALMTIS